MFAIFRRELRAGLKPTVFWALGVFVLVAASFWKYSGLAVASDATSAMTSVMPHIVQVMFGMTLPVNTPQGYFVCICLWVGIAVFLHAALLGASTISKEEQGKTADFLLVRPLSRAKVVAAKSLAGALQIIIVNAAVWVGVLAFFIPMLESDASVAASIPAGATALGGNMDIYVGIYLSLLGMLFSQIVFLMLGMLCAVIARKADHAALYAALMVLATYAIYCGIAESGQVDVLGVFSPFWYFSASRVMADGLSLPYLLISGVVIFAGVLASITLYRHRDIS